MADVRVKIGTLRRPEGVSSWPKIPANNHRSHPSKRSTTGQRSAVCPLAEGFIRAKSCDMAVGYSGLDSRPLRNWSKPTRLPSLRVASLFKKTPEVTFHCPKKSKVTSHRYSLFRKPFRLFNETGGVNLAYI